MFGFRLAMRHCASSYCLATLTLTWYTQAISRCVLALLPRMQIMAMVRHAVAGSCCHDDSGSPPPLRRGEREKIPV
uniref:Putative secreted protein n=1 Tax=Anopheles darlingi TaxID=43151 RepID=A0A2M4DEJ1_ANODA